MSVQCYTTYEKCKIFVVPTRFAAGIPLKLIEAMSWGIPSVVSQLAASQLNLTDGVEVLVGRTPEEFAQKVITLYQDKELWQQISQNGIEYIRQTCNPEALKSHLKNILDASITD